MFAGYGSGTVEYDQSEKQHHEARLLQLNCDRAHQLLGWYSRWNVDQTVVKTAEWYKQTAAGTSAAEVTSRQLREYFPEL